MDRYARLGSEAFSAQAAQSSRAARRLLCLVRAGAAGDWRLPSPRGREEEQAKAEATALAVMARRRARKGRARHRDGAAAAATARRRGGIARGGARRARPRRARRAEAGPARRHGPPLRRVVLRALPCFPGTAAAAAGRRCRRTMRRRGAQGPLRVVPESPP